METHGHNQYRITYCANVILDERESERESERERERDLRFWCAW